MNQTECFVSAEKLYERIALIRKLEEKLLELFTQGKLSGTTHTSIGQEAIAVGVGQHLIKGDVVFASHRCHGHFVAYGGSPRELLAEVMGREGAVCGGRGGSQHLHFERFFSNGVQGGIVGNATGAALGLRLCNSRNIAIVFLGDGTLGQGIVYESLNFAALQRLPIMYVVENNGIAQTTPAELGIAGSISDRGRSFGMAVLEIESPDPAEICANLGNAIENVRESSTPLWCVVETCRFSAHSKGDDTRSPEDVERHRGRDPLRILSRQIPPARVQELEQQASREISRLVDEVSATPLVTDSQLASASGCVDGRQDMPTPLVEESVAFVTSLNRGLNDLISENAAVFFMGEDVLDPYGGAFKVARGLSSRFPKQTITTPISEAGIVAWATGAALVGARPIVEIMFGDFTALATDQILNHAAKYGWLSRGKVEVPIVIRAPMGGRRGYGPTHSQSIEAMYLSIPDLVIVAPTHLLDPGELLKRATLAIDQPVLFVENKMLYSESLVTCIDGRIDKFAVRISSKCFPTVHLSLADFETPDVVMVAYGGSVPLSMEAAKQLMLEDEILADVVVVTSVAPIPVDDLLVACGNCRRLVTIEEGVKTAGWGAELVAKLLEASLATDWRFRRIGSLPCPIPAAKHLEQQVLPSVEMVVGQVREIAV